MPRGSEIIHIVIEIKIPKKKAPQIEGPFIVIN